MMRGGVPSFWQKPKSLFLYAIAKLAPKAHVQIHTPTSTHIVVLRNIWQNKHFLFEPLTTLTGSKLYHKVMNIEYHDYKSLPSVLLHRVLA